MSTLSLLPLIRVNDGVQTDEDWSLSIAFYLDDGVTPIPLTGLSFTLAVGSLATLGTATGEIAIAGPLDNILIITVLASEKAGWPAAVYSLSLSATDGIYSQDIFASSSLSVGAAQVASVVLLVAPNNIPRSIAAAVPAALGVALQALQPQALASTLATLTNTELSTLAQAVFGALPVQTGSSAPVATGQAFVNTSGYVVIAQ